ncbi:sugar porter family MFS transporter [Croceivirga sp. JEA036]|uniref:sugar porter family MFS transporter n=1 Tax=Croceivirga sp. JEA036 TaxID=2721162 RepID=UPI001439AD76|nr:sugar porter family MFS transporter [Croceivirga sp. JEA036]NJB35253.1 sugar porter family MFS transporter [Croceivirga sp. JEA036]
MNDKVSKHYIIRIAAIVALGGFILGFDASVISGTLKFVGTEFNLNDIQLGWLVSSITLTAALGTFIAGPLSDKVGRRTVLKYAAILFAISALCSALAPTFTILIVGRLIGGFSVGAALIIAPMYIAEVSPAEKRGQMVSFNQLNIVIGISAAFFTNYLILKLGESGLDWVSNLNIDRWNWRWMLGLETIPALMYYLGLFFVPQSPRWLTMHGYPEKALSTLEKFAGVSEAGIQMRAIEKSIQQEQEKEKVHIKEIFKKNMRLVIVVGIIVAIFQQLVGINSVMFYAPMIFEQTGIGTDASFLQAILVGLVNLVFTVLAMFIIDRLGRKPMLIYGMIGMGISMLLLTYGFKTASYTLDNKALEQLPSAIQNTKLAPIIGQTFDNDLDFKTALAQHLGTETAKQYETNLVTAAASMNTSLILIGILLFVSFYAVSIGPVMWVLFSELFPNRIRGLAISFVGLVNLTFAFLVQLVFPWQLSNFGNALTFLLYAIFAVIGLLFIIAKVPETKGKSLEELEAKLVNYTNG